MRSAGGRVLDGGDPGLRRVPRRDGGEANPEGERLEPGLLLGADDLGIDEIRAQFAACKVGMF